MHPGIGTSLAANILSTCVPSSERRRLLKSGLATSLASWISAARGQAVEVNPTLSSTKAAALTDAPPEVRGTWLTTTANDAISSPERTATTMRRLREIGLNTVYVEVWKNGYTQYPSAVLQATLGVSQRPGQAVQNPSDTASDKPAVNAPRDLLQETLIEAHRNGLNYIAWFEYGFMAAHASTNNHLRRLKPEWLSRNAQGSEVAPNGFVWMNPLHPQARRFLLDLVLEAVARYDLDGVQFDDRIVWPHVTMGYDETTRAIYAAEHGGREPPACARDPDWMRWRSDKLNALVQAMVAELRAEIRVTRPGLRLSLSPAVYPWSYDNYLLNWPQWANWPAHLRFDELVPQAYRTTYAAFEAIWLEQTQALQAAADETKGLAGARGYRPQELVAGVRINGAGDESSWPQLRDSMALVRKLGQGGHVLWFSRGVLDLHADALTSWYAQTGPAPSPFYATGWRRPAVALQRKAGDEKGGWSLTRQMPPPPAGHYRVIAFEAGAWRYLADSATLLDTGPAFKLQVPAAVQRVELLPDRRAAMHRSP
jgi:uncharacterized lipoprotein YddW (UPF0748 family)